MGTTYLLNHTPYMNFTSFSNHFLFLFQDPELHLVIMCLSLLKSVAVPQSSLVFQDFDTFGERRSVIW